MRKITAGLFVSLDGVVESPEQWTGPYFNEEVSQEVGASFAATDAMLLGRRTYQVFAASWPERGTDEPLAQQMNSMPKFVVSQTLTRVEWNNSKLVTGDVVTELNELKRGPGKNIAISGSPTLVRSLLRDGVLDELQLLVFPIVLGSGKRLFPEGGGEVPLKLARSKAFATGVVALYYQPA
jgi:dihydrofolate reductase